MPVLTIKPLWDRNCVVQNLLWLYRGSQKGQNYPVLFTPAPPLWFLPIPPCSLKRLGTAMPYTFFKDYTADNQLYVVRQQKKRLRKATEDGEGPAKKVKLPPPPLECTAFCFAVSLDYSCVSPSPLFTSSWCNAPSIATSKLCSPSCKPFCKCHDMQGRRNF